MVGNGTTAFGLQMARLIYSLPLLLLPIVVLIRNKNIMVHSLLLLAADTRTTTALDAHGRRNIGCCCSFRAYLPPTESRFRPMLMGQIQQLPNYCSISEMHETFVEFTLQETNHGDERHDPLSFYSSIHQLPATKVTIVVPIPAFTTNITANRRDEDTRIFPSPVEETKDSMIPLGKNVERLMEIWSALGNRRRAGNAARTTFSVTTAATSMNIPSSHSNRRGRKRLLVPNPSDSVSQVALLQVAATALRNDFSTRFGWTPVSSSSGVTGRGHWKNSDLEFQISSCSTTPTSMDGWNLELLALTRVFPLPTDLQIPRKSKRLESFVVAKTANIQPNDTVFDPQCQRGTILIEAAKYWPLASKFIGMDSNMGHLEHARMNADSTRTCLDLRHYVLSKKSKYDDRSWSIVVESLSVDKIVGCLPFGQSLESYHSLKWASVLKPGGSMTLVIDQKSLQPFMAAIQHRISTSFGLDSECGLCVSFLRQPSIEWGKDRATIVQVWKRRINSRGDSVLSSLPNGQLLSPGMDTSDEHTQTTTTRYGLLEWESEKPCHQSFPDFWAMTRLQKTNPSLVPIDRAQLANGRTNRILLSSNNKNHYIHQSSDAA